MNRTWDGTEGKVHAVLIPQTDEERDVLFSTYQWIEEAKRTGKRLARVVGVPFLTKMSEPAANHFGWTYQIIGKFAHLVPQDLPEYDWESLYPDPLLSVRNLIKPHRTVHDESIPDDQCIVVKWTDQDGPHVVRFLK